MSNDPSQPTRVTPPPVSLVGAGPGDAGLITAVGLDRLRAADVVIYDALANPQLLDEAPSHAERIDVGKRARQHRLSQDQINDLLVEKARQGGRIVRLKGGDPYLFGRGAEEAAHLARHGIAVEVIPGITAGIAAPMTAGIPVTHRKLASTVTFVTGHEEPGKPESAVNYAALATMIRTGGTVCFYMGVGRLPEIAAALTEAGLDAQTPAAAIQWGTTPRQRTVRNSLAALPEAVRRAELGAPAIVVVGTVASLPDTEPGLDFFTQRPLFGQTVLVTRTRQQASELRQQLEALGAEVIEAPTIELVPPSDWSKVDAALRDVQQYDWLVLTSTNSIATLQQRFDALGFDARDLAGVKLAVVGEATAAELRQKMGLRADLVPPRAVGESIAEELIAQHDAANKSILLLRADIARPALPQRLREAGAKVDEVVAYHTKLADALPDEALDALREGRIDWITFTSASTASNLAELLGHERDLIAGAMLASIGPITSEAVRRLGFDVKIEASTASIAGLVEAIARTT